ncbi:MAG: SEL1-like repeat protein [Alphaproteobacteria bacterium]|nr:SEL1-like repeat protein [Alphaproteobacteria bacterium]
MFRLVVTALCQCTWLLLIFGVSVISTTVAADAKSKSEAQAECLEHFGPGSVAQEELDFGEASYVCSCESPAKWNEDSTRCVGGVAEKTRLPESPSPDFTETPPATDRGTTKDSSEDTSADPAPRSVEELFQSGKQAADSENYAEARLWYNRAIDAGSPGAMVNLALFYLRGTGVDKDPARAAELFQRAADKGTGLAMYYLAHQYSSGQGIRRSKRLAAEWYQKAVDNGIARAAFWLGSLYDDGKGVRRDRARAAELVVHALQQGSYDHAVKQMTTNERAWSKRFRREMQKVMRREGHYDGAIDGSFGSGTKRAIRSLAGQ